MYKNIKVVIGANFGDEGKGLMTDYFCSQTKNKALVVLSNGGAQRGHTVVTPEGYRHVFHHFGSGSFVGADTYICKYFIVNPCIFMQEYREIYKKHTTMPKFKVFVDPRCQLTTIYDMLINQVIEFDRGTDKHGSCGIGVFETLYRNNKGLDFKHINMNPTAMTVGLFSAMNYVQKYEFLTYLRKEYVFKRINELNLKKASKIFENIIRSDEVIKNYIADFEEMEKIITFKCEDVFNDYNDIIFENGQGLLLDQHNMDYFPHLTPSNTGLTNPLNILTEYGYEGPIEACYVTRTYVTRHGKGRLNWECTKKEINPNMIDLTNVPNPFQDTLRYGILNKDTLYKRIHNNSDIINNRIYIKPYIALTHINEYHISTKETLFFSYGMTRNDIKTGELHDFR